MGIGTGVKVGAMVGTGVGGGLVGSGVFVLIIPEVAVGNRVLVGSTGVFVKF